MEIRPFKKITLLLAAVMMVVALSSRSYALSIKEGEVAPDFEISKLDGGKDKLSNHRGKVVLLAFWASWCPRCLEELAFLQGLYTGNKEKLAVLAVNQDTKNLSETHLAKLKEMTSEIGITFPVLIDLDFDVWQRYGINALPTSVIVDKEGKVLFAEPNYYWASQKKIKGILAAQGIGTAED